MKILADFQGRQIRLTDERLEHIRAHPEMSSMESALERTLSEPELVVESASDPTTSLYYHYYRQTLVGEKWLCVVVKLTADPFVLTAYLTDKPKKGTEQWRKR